MKTEILNRIIYRLFRSLNSQNSEKTNQSIFRAVSDCENLKNNG